MVLHDHLLILDVLNRYAEACDRRDWPLFDEVFTDDAIGVYSGAVLHGRDAIVDRIRNLLGGCGPSQHLLGLHEVDVDGDRATSSCRVRAWHVGIGAHAGITYEAFARYHDDLVRTAAGWRIRRRELVIDAHLGTRDIFGPPPESTARVS